MARGPLGNRRLTTIGPFTYDEESPPEVPRGFQPPDDITNARGDFRWWKQWDGIEKGQAGATIIYNPENDRVFIENRVFPPQGYGNFYTHDDMVVDIIENSPFPKFPDVSVPAEGGFHPSGDDLIGTFEMPTAAGGAFVTTERLAEEKIIIEDGEDMEIEWFYKAVYALKKVDFPGDTMVTLKHKLGPRAGSIFEARREFELEDAYRLLSFEGKLPEPEVQIE